MVLFMEQPASAIKEEATNVVHVFHMDCYYTVLPSYVWPAPSADVAILRGTMAHHGAPCLWHTLPCQAFIVLWHHRTIIVCARRQMQ